MDTNAKKQDALAFLTSHRIGTLATLAPGGTPRARPVYYVCDDAFRIYFLTLSNTRKVADLAHDAHAAFTVFTEDVPQMIQIEGTAEDLTNDAVIDPVVRALLDALMSNATYHAPLTRFDPGKVTFYGITPSAVHWGDFTHGHGTTDVLADLV